MSTSHLFWSESYRPKTIDECILPPTLADQFNEMVKSGSVPNLLLTGPQGVGKTTVAKALCQQLGYDVLFINGSNEGRLIDTVRTKITTFASTVSMFSDRKAILIDEVDNVPDTVTLALRSFIEQYSNNCSFILTCNYKNRLPDPFRSRFSEVDFNFPKESHAALIKGFHGRCCAILDEKGIAYDKKTLGLLVFKFFPDFRRMLNELQRLTITGRLSEEVVQSITVDDVAGLVANMKARNFKAVTDYIFGNPSLDFTQFCRQVISHLKDQVVPQNVPALYIWTADHLHMHTTAMDPQINMIAYLSRIMLEVEWK